MTASIIGGTRTSDKAPGLDDLLIELYCLLDDAFPAPRLGRPRRVSDAELLCLAMAQVLVGARSERAWLRQAPQRLGHLFPRLVSREQYNRASYRAFVRPASRVKPVRACSPSREGRLAKPPCRVDERDGRQNTRPTTRQWSEVMKRARVLDQVEEWAKAHGRDPVVDPRHPDEVVFQVQLGDGRGPAVGSYRDGVLLVSLVHLDELPEDVKPGAPLLAMAAINFRTGMTKLGFSPETREIRAQALTFARDGLQDGDIERIVADVEWVTQSWYEVTERLNASLEEA